MQFSKFIKKLRFDLNLTQVKLAECLKMKQTTVSAWETGDRALSIKSRLKLLKFCQKHGIQFKG